MNMEKDKKTRLLRIRNRLLVISRDLQKEAIGDCEEDLRKVRRNIILAILSAELDEFQKELGEF